MRETKYRVVTEVGGKPRMYDMPDLSLNGDVYWAYLKNEPVTRQIVEIDGKKTILEQYIGKKDDVKVDIYEGDIVLITFADGTWVKSDIVWASGSLKWVVRGEAVYGFELAHLGNASIEVVGNIHGIKRV